jgi:hypothetical protein
VRPVLDSGLSAVLFSGRACAHAIPAEETKQTAISAMRMSVPHYVSPQNQYTPLQAIALRIDLDQPADASL